MNRTLLTLSTVGLALAVPGAAAASRHHTPSRGHHHHAAGHARRAEHLGPSATAPASSPAASQDAGTVASFAGGVLVIKLADGSSVTGKVGAATQIDCNAASGTAMAHESRHGGDGNGQSSDSGDDHGTAAGTPGTGTGLGLGTGTGAGPGTGAGNEGDDMGDDDAAQPACDATALVVGAVVHEADLLVGSGGSQFQKIDLAA